MDSIRIGWTCRADAPAKINLFLEVLGKRDDGFHEIETLMTAISLHDTLYFKPTSDGLVRVSCDWACGIAAGYFDTGGQRPNAAGQIAAGLGPLPRDEDNIVVEVVERFRRAAGVTSGATIRIVKRIPSAAGMGGASSDAAAALLLANSVWKVGWDNERLAALAASIGSDVPFFISSLPGALALCRGRGEQIQAVPSAARLNLVIARPPVGLSTATVYANCQPADQPVPARPLAEALAAGRTPLAGRLLLNRLESAASRLSPWIQRLRTLFRRLDVLGYQMSGSGSSFFGICRHRQHARRVAGVLRAANIGRVFTASSVPSRCRIAAIST